MVSTKKGTIQPQWRSQGLLLCYDWINLVLLLSVYLEGEWLSHPWICKGLSSFILNLWKIIKWFNSSLSVHLTWNMYWHMGSLCPFSKRDNKKINMAQRDVAAETGKSSAQQPRAEVSRDHELYSIYTNYFSQEKLLPLLATLGKRSIHLFSSAYYSSGSWCVYHRLISALQI